MGVVYAIVIWDLKLADYCTELYYDQLVISYFIVFGVFWRVWPENEVNFNVCEHLLQASQ